VIFSRRPDIHKTDKSTSSRSSQADTAAFCEAVALFNLGLVYHQRAQHLGENRALLSALDLYDQSLGMLQTVMAVNSDEASVLKLTVINNKIHVLNDIASFASAQEQVNDLLVQSVNALDACKNNGATISFLTKTDIDHFLLNALVIRRSGDTAPSA
jgi:hypothetical protein